MPVILAQNRKQLRQSVGRNLKDAFYAGTTTSAGSTTTFIDTLLEKSDDYINGRWWLGVSGSNDGELSVVEDYTGPAQTGELRKAVTSVGSGVSYELWNHDFHPDDINDYLNQAIRASGVTRRAAPVLNEFFHTSPKVRSYEVSSSLVGVDHLYYAATVERDDVENCDGAWTEQVDSDVTHVADAEDKRQGSSSAKFTIAAGLAAADIIASNAITSLDISQHTHIGFWAKSSVALDAGDIQLLLDDTASVASPLETLDVPALTADTWTWCRVPLANPELDTAIISVGFNYAVDKGAMTFHSDGIEAFTQYTEDWEPLNKRVDFRIDNDNRRIVLTREGLGRAQYKHIWIEGRKKPTELTADTTNCDIEPDYIIKKATALAYRASANRRAGNRQGADISADFYEGLARDALTMIRHPNSTLWIDD